MFRKKIVLKLLNIRDGNYRSLGVLSFQVIGSAQKQMIVNLYKSKKSEVPSIQYKDLMNFIAVSLGIGVNRVRMTVSEYKTINC